MEDDYMRERAADVKDISERVIAVLNGKVKGAEMLSEPMIIVAEDQNRFLRFHIENSFRTVDNSQFPIHGIIKRYGRADKRGNITEGAFAYAQGQRKCHSRWQENQAVCQYWQ